MSKWLRSKEAAGHSYVIADKLVSGAPSKSFFVDSQQQPPEFGS